MRAGGPASTLGLPAALEQDGELGEGDRDAVGVLDLRLALARPGRRWPAPSRCGGRRASARRRRGAAARRATVSPSGCSSTRGAHAAQALGEGGDAVALLDPQLGRAAHDRERARRARAAATARIGTSSISAGTSAALTIALRAAARRAPRSSPPAPASSLRTPVSIWRAHRAAARRGTPCARGLSSTPSMRTRASGRTSAATTRKAALETSPGTSRSRGARRAPPSTDTAAPVDLDRRRRRRAAGARCGRGWAPARRPCVRPSACRPASRTAVFTCALGDGQAQCDRLQRAAVDRPGAAFRRSTTCARPSRASGSATRSTGRRAQRRVAGERRAERTAGQRRPPACAASIPSCRRRAGPAAPSGSRALGPRPRPCGPRAGPRRRAPARQRSVAAQSSAVEKLPNRLCPSASAAHDGEAVGERLVPGKGEPASE